MPTLSYRSIVGAFRILRRRAVAAGFPGLKVWADAGELAATQVGTRVATLAHADEVADLEAARAIDAGLAGLRDGRADPADLAHFERAASLTRRSAALAHDIGEAVR